MTSIEDDSPDLFREATREELTRYGENVIGLYREGANALKPFVDLGMISLTPGEEAAPFRLPDIIEPDVVEAEVVREFWPGLAARRLETQTAEEPVSAVEEPAPEEPVEPEPAEAEASVSTESGVPQLTPGEMRELVLASKGLSINEIASQRFVSDHTIKAQRRKATDKLSAATIEQAVYLALKLELIPLKLRDTRNSDYKLSPQLFELLELASRGLKGVEVDEALGLHRQTVKTRRQDLFYQLRAKNMSEAIRIAFEFGFLPLDGAEDAEPPAVATDTSDDDLDSLIVSTLEPDEHTDSELEPDAEDEAAEPAPAHESRRNKHELEPISVVMKGKEFDAASLGLTSTYEVEFLKLMPRFGEDPFNTTMLIDAGFGSDANSETAKRSALSTITPVLLTRLARAAEEEALSRKRDGKGPFEFSVLVPMIIDGQEVPVSVKKAVEAAVGRAAANEVSNEPKGSNRWLEGLGANDDFVAGDDDEDTRMPAAAERPTGNARGDKKEAAKKKSTVVLPKEIPQSHNIRTDYINPDDMLPLEEVMANLKLRDPRDIAQNPLAKQAVVKAMERGALLDSRDRVTIPLTTGYFTPTYAKRGYSFERQKKLVSLDKVITPDSTFWARGLSAESVTAITGLKPVHVHAAELGFWRDQLTDHPALRPLYDKVLMDYQIEKAKEDARAAAEVAKA